MPRKRKETAAQPLVLKGWQCPVCSRVMAPHVTSCERCVGVAPAYVPTPIRVEPWPQTPRIFDPFWYYTLPPVTTSTPSAGPYTTDVVTLRVCDA